MVLDHQVSRQTGLASSWLCYLSPCCKHEAPDDSSSAEAGLKKRDVESRGERQAHKSLPEHAGGSGSSSRSGLQLAVPLALPLALASISSRLPQTHQIRSCGRTEKTPTEWL